MRVYLATDGTNIEFDPPIGETDHVHLLGIQRGKGQRTEQISDIDLVSGDHRENLVSGFSDMGDSVRHVGFWTQERQSRPAPIATAKVEASPIDGSAASATEGRSFWYGLLVHQEEDVANEFLAHRLASLLYEELDNIRGDVYHNSYIEITTKIKEEKQ